jgi:hypothetical protein
VYLPLIKHENIFLALSSKKKSVVFKLQNHEDERYQKWQFITDFLNGDKK